MDILTVISIVVLLFVGFYDFFVNKLKFIKKSSPDKNQKRSLSRSLILFSILYAPLALVFQIIIDSYHRFFSTHYKVVDYPLVTNRRFFDIDYYLKFFDFSSRFADSLINNYLIFTVIYVLISIWLYRTRQKKKLFFDAIDILKLYLTKKNLARGILLAIAIIVTKPIIHYLLCYDCRESAPLKNYYSIIFTGGKNDDPQLIYFIHSIALILSLNFIYNELVKKSGETKKDDVISKLSYLEELYKKKLIDKDEYESKLESLKKEASKSI